MVDMTAFRANWAPLARIAYNSAADITADWFYYDYVVKLENPELEKYELYLFIFFIVSAVMCGITLLGVVIKGCCPESRIGCSLNKILGLEAFVGDIPQLVLTALITYDLGMLDMEGAFNFATSGYNLINNALESCGNVSVEPKELEEVVEEEIVEDGELVEAVVDQA